MALTAGSSVALTQADWPHTITVRATGNSPDGRGARGAGAVASRARRARHHAGTCDCTRKDLESDARLRLEGRYGAHRQRHLPGSQYRRAKGRTHAVVPGKTASKYLHYGRIILDAGDAPLRFDTKQLETGLVCLNGSATVRTGDQSFTLDRYDSLYVSRDASIEVAPGAHGCDLAEIAAPVERTYPVQFVSFKSVQQDPGLHLNVGNAPNQRELNILIGKNVEAGRILAGVTFSAPGNWTSWPPHEHAAMLEEAYLYIDMPAPSFGLQLVYTNKNDPELATIVRQDDVC